MGTRPGDPRHGDSARLGDAPTRRAARSFADGEETEPHDERPGSDGRMDQLIRQHDGLRQRTLEITFLESDAEAHSFTFG
jgi:hypothetical protein